MNLDLDSIRKRAEIAIQDFDNLCGHDVLLLLKAYQHYKALAIDTARAALAAQAALSAERDQLAAEVQVARQRLGPAGWKLLQELNDLRRLAGPRHGDRIALAKKLRGLASVSGWTAVIEGMKPYKDALNEAADVIEQGVDVPDRA